MNKNTYYVLGIMSGTSLDGIDIAYIKFERQKSWSFKIKEAETFSYSKLWKNKLQNAIELTQVELEVLDEAYTRFLGEIINSFINKHKIVNLDLVCSHGHTIHHRPEDKYTCQIGNKPVLSQLLQKNVICDFRVQDVSLGGQGAPLVPIGDKLLFPAYDYCVNLGGFANISTQKDNQRLAYDICPVNIVLNHYSEQIGYAFDDGGKLAASGAIHPELLNKLNNLAYYKLSPPKSLGLEWVKENVFPIINSYEISTKNILRTFTEHVVFQISSEIEKPNEKVLITGGGAYNNFLIQRLRMLSNSNIIVPEATVIEFKEALIFGLLGVLKFEDKVNVLSSVTGAKRDHSSGVVYMFQK